MVNLSPFVPWSFSGYLEVRAPGLGFSGGAFGDASAPPGLVRMRATNLEGVVFEEQNILVRAGTLTSATAHPKPYSVEKLCALDGGVPPVPGTTAAAGQTIPCELL